MLDARVTRGEGGMLLGLLERRIHERVPVPYLIGRAWLAGVEFIVDERVIVPRSPIAGLLDDGLAPWLVAEPLRILDLCTGSGCLGLLAALAYPDAEVVLADLSADALEVARTNVERLGLSDRVTLRQGDGPAALGAEASFDLVICNPPYVDASDLASMPEEFAREPTMALAGGDDGLELVSAWLPELPAHMSHGAVLVLELGNSAPALGVRYPELPVSWPALETGGTGVLLITAEDLGALAAG
jgi:ribosomal protein L3 glutamine methyltransferase